jgi:hypothetical protein
VWRRADDLADGVLTLAERELAEPIGVLARTLWEGAVTIEYVRGNLDARQLADDRSRRSASTAERAVGSGGREQLLDDGTELLAWPRGTAFTCSMAVAVSGSAATAATAGRNEGGSADVRLRSLPPVLKHSSPRPTKARSIKRSSDGGVSWTTRSSP